MSPGRISNPEKEVLVMPVTGQLNLTMAAVVKVTKMMLRKDNKSRHTGCFKKSFTTFKEYINLFRGHVKCFEMS
jgi:hypothetical protein